ncbi:MAG: hypothetical protein HYS35_09280 [Betaproteobacteria bacterium]|nr:hypothetical protein [Betaproteobacteria bacterium]
MSRAILLAAAVSAAVSTAALADNPLVQKEITAMPAKVVKPLELKASKAVRLSDAELDDITAGVATHFTGKGFTVVLNPGRAVVENPQASHAQRVDGFRCINCPF